jgi:hypothetical protein
VQQDGNIHEKVAIADVVKVVLDVFMNQEGAISAELP